MSDINHVPVRLTGNLVALFDCELANEWQMIRDAKARDEIPPPTSIETVLDSLEQGLEPPEALNVNDWLTLIRLIQETYDTRPSNLVLEQMVAEWHEKNPR